MEEINPSLLVGKKIENYTLEELISETKKNMVFSAKHNILGRTDVLKILKPGQGEKRERQFIAEGENLVKIDSYENLQKVHGAGEEGEYKFLALQKLKSEEINLYERVRSGKKMSLNEILEIMQGSSNGLASLHKSKITHGDIKLKNLLRDSKGVTHIIDLGGRMSSAGNYQGDIKELVDCYSSVIKLSEKPLPKSLLNLVSEWQSNPGKHTALSINGKIKDFRNGITRRKFLFKSGIFLTGTSALGSIVHATYKKIKYERSIEKIIDEISNRDYKTCFPDLFKELEFRICDQKIRWLEKEKIPKNRLPYATTNDGNWQELEKTFWTDGFWPAILLEAYNTTQDVFFLNSARERAEGMKITELDNKGNTSARFLYSHIPLLELTKNGAYERELFKALEIITENYHGENKNIAASHRIMIDAGTAIDFVPFLIWGYKTTHQKKYIDMARDHIKKLVKMNVRENGSVRKTALMDSSGNYTGELNSKGISNSSTHSRSHTQLLSGLTEFLLVEKDAHLLEKAETVAEYLLKNLPEDCVPYFDFSATFGSNYPRDTSAAAISLGGLKNLYKLTSKPFYQDAFLKTRHSLIIKYLEPDLKNREGLLREGCDNWKRGEYTKNSLIWGDYFFLKNLK